jgi:hypothetical protein
MRHLNHLRDVADFTTNLIFQDMQNNYARHEGYNSGYREAQRHAAQQAEYVRIKAFESGYDHGFEMGAKGFEHNYVQCGVNTWCEVDDPSTP